MSTVSSIATSGMAAATMRLQMLANNVANAVSSDVDRAEGIVQQLMARVNFAANVEVIKTDARMTATLFDITV